MTHDSGATAPPLHPAPPRDPFRFLVEAVTENGLLLLDLEGRIVTWNAGAERLTGFSAAEILGRVCPAVNKTRLPGILELTSEGHRTLQAAREHGRFDDERQIRRKDGSMIWVTLTVTAWREGGVLRGYGILLVDIDARKKAERAEQELRTSEARYRTLVDHATDSFALQRADGTILDVNQHLCESLGYAREELIGRPAYELNADSTPSGVAEARRELEEKGIATIEGRHRRKDGSTFPVEIRVRRFFLEGEPFTLGLARDITERKRAEDALRRNEERLRRAQAIAQATSWAYNVALGTFEALEESRGLFGMATIDVPLDIVFRSIHPDDLVRVKEAWQATLAGAPYEIEHRVVMGDDVRWAYVRAAPELGSDGRIIQITGITQEITGRKKLEEQLLQSQKMDAIGQLAGTVAHDFNNLLLVINGYADLLLAELPDESTQRHELEQILDAGARAADLTRQLLTFSRKQLSEPKVLDLNGIVAGAETMLRRLIGEDITISTALAPSLSPVNVDPGQMHQVLLNLAVNARDAMPKGGRLFIETSNRGANPNKTPELPPGPLVELTVSDTGVGIPDDVKGHIFEPFFTTKGVGRGTGLGLATVYGIVKKAGGHISFESAEGRGTTFRIVLPAVTVRE